MMGKIILIFENSRKEVMVTRIIVEVVEVDGKEAVDSSKC